jgi:trk system potassium uptake protein TrkA
MRIAIAGAGVIGRSVARALLEDGHTVLLIEVSRSEYRPDLVPAAHWMCADACELETLTEAGLETADVFVAAMDRDQANLVACMLAKSEFKVAQVVARVSDPETEPLFTSDWGVDVAVSIPRQLVASFEEGISVGTIVRLMSLQHSRADILEITLPHTSALAGTPLGKLSLPADSAALAVVREDTMIAASPDVVLHGADVLLLAAAASAEAALRDVLEETA